MELIARKRVAEVEGSGGGGEWKDTAKEKNERLVKGWELPERVVDPLGGAKQGGISAIRLDATPACFTRRAGRGDTPACDPVRACSWSKAGRADNDAPRPMFLLWRGRQHQCIIIVKPLQSFTSDATFFVSPCTIPQSLSFALL